MTKIGFEDWAPQSLVELYEGLSKQIEQVSTTAGPARHALTGAKGVVGQYPLPPRAESWPRVSHSWLPSLCLRMDFMLKHKR